MIWYSQFDVLKKNFRQPNIHYIFQLGHLNNTLLQISTYYQLSFTL